MYITLGAIALVLVIIALMYNGLVSARNRAEEGWSGIDVQLKRRHDLIPNLVETVKGYAAHESSVLEKVVQARSQAQTAHSHRESQDAENLLTGALRQVFALSEAYPDLKASQNFQQLQMQLADTEDKIQAARRIYNGNVRVYNTRLQSVPWNLVAKLGAFSQREFFEVETPAERENVAVSFS